MSGFCERRISTAEIPMVAQCYPLGTIGPHEKQIDARTQVSMVGFDPRYKVGRTGTHPELFQ
jgi:hypothetical protein